MNGLLDEVDTNAQRPGYSSRRTHRPQEKRRNRALSPSNDTTRHVSKKTKVTDSRTPTTPPADTNVNADDDHYMMTIDDENLPLDDPAPSSPIAKAAERKANHKIKVEEEDEDDGMEVAQAGGIVTASVNMSGTRPPAKIKKSEAYPSPASSSPTRPSTSQVDASAWNDVTSRLNIMTSTPPTESMGFGKIDYQDAVEPDGSLRMFWTDYTEVNGSLCLFGKVLNKKTGNHVSCFVKVDNILRKLFFLPRQYRVQGTRETTEEIDMKDVYEEVDGLMGRMKVGMHKIKPCTRKYAFELPDVPKEGEYLKLLYPYSSKNYPPSIVYILTLSRTSSPTRTSDWINIFTCVWYQHSSIRAICVVEKHHGSLLAVDRGCRVRCGKQCFSLQVGSTRLKTSLHYSSIGVGKL